jgi:hypothetical protein
MLGLGLQTRKQNISGYKGLLDDLNIDSFCKLGFSNVKLTKNFDGFSHLIYREADATTKYFYFKGNGMIDEYSILNWLNGSVGKVKQWGNQGNINYPAYQNDPDKMPEISNGSIIHENGFYFDGIDDCFQVDDYSGIQIVNQDLNIYLNITPIDSGGIPFSKNINSAGASQYTITLNYGLGAVYSIMEGNIRHSSPVPYNNNSVNTMMLDWSNDIVTMKCNEDFSTGNYSNTLTNREYVRIGCIHDSDLGEDRFIKGNINTVMIFNKTQLNNYDYIASKV